MTEKELNIRLTNKKYANLVDFKTDYVDLESIERSLNYLYRFTGHHVDRVPLTVAQHTKLVAKIASMVFPDDDEVMLDCIMHDFPESITGDVSSPTKKILGKTFKDYEERIEGVFYEKLWPKSVDYTEETYHNRKICDLLSLDIERRSMWADKTPRAKWPPIPAHENFISLQDKRELFDWAQKERFVPLAKMYIDALAKVKKNRKIPTYEVGE